MNPALTPLSRIREMTNTELVAFAKDHSHLTILEREFLKRMESTVNEDERKSKLYADFMRNNDALRSLQEGFYRPEPAAQAMIDWAKARMGDPA